MGFVYSHQFWRGLLPFDPTYVYTVPVGVVAVIRSITVAWATSVGTDAYAQVLTDGQQARLWIAHVGAEPGSAAFDGRIVLKSTQQIRVYVYPPATAYMTISGYELKD